MNDTSFELISCPLDPDERESSIVKKINSCMNSYSNVAFQDPAEGLRAELPTIKGRKKSIDIESWLLPTPPRDMIFMLTVENFVTFIDSNGCREYANKVRDAVKSSLPDTPIVVGVDHSLSGGAIESLAKEQGGENMRLVVFDSHFDYIPASIRCGLIQYDMETNPRTKFSPSNPYVFNRPDSYNADSFLYFLRKTISPEDTYMVGISDYPPREALESKDERVSKYVEFYQSIQDEGVNVIRKEDLKTKSDWVKSVLGSTDKPFTYISIDVDVCANAGLRGTRFLNFHGLTASDLYGIVELIRSSLTKSKLVGLDLMEFDVYTAGSYIYGKKDRTYEIAAEAFRRLTNIRV